MWATGPTCHSLSWRPLSSLVLAVADVVVPHASLYRLHIIVIFLSSSHLMPQCHCSCAICSSYMLILFSTASTSPCPSFPSSQHAVLLFPPCLLSFLWLRHARHGCTSLSFRSDRASISASRAPSPWHDLLFLVAACCNPPTSLFLFFSHPSHPCASLFHRRDHLSTLSSPELTPHPTILPYPVLHSLSSLHCCLFPVLVDPYLTPSPNSSRAPPLAINSPLFAAFQYCPTSPHTFLHCSSSCRVLCWQECRAHSRR